ncbi:MAG: DMT family transporter [Candidatus Fermentibacteraceae bacterium]|nr:DMT family transporter [Candidatus Fermentibacteraceae bacterium]MBN2607592.1 DMT family transporter [Candidatus Fermentibacteraceae bacterium]
MKPRLLALAAVLFWSTAASAFKITLRWLSPYQLVLLSSAVSTLALWTVVLIRGGVPSPEPHPDRWLKAAARGALNPFFYYLVLMEAYDRLPAQIAMVINYLWPVMLMILSAPLLKQVITMRMALASIVSFCGVGVLALGGSPVGGSLSLPAMGLALLSTVIWSLFWILNVRSGGDSVGNLARSFASGLLFLLLYGLVRGELSLIPGIDVRGIFGTVYIGLFEMGITFVVWLRALQLARTTSEVGNYIYLTPFLALVFIGAAVGETIGLTTVAGLVLVITGILLQQLGRRGAQRGRT